MKIHITLENIIGLFVFGMIGIALLVAHLLDRWERFKRRRNSRRRL